MDTNNTKSSKRKNYYKLAKERQRSLLQEYYADKYKAHMLNVEYVQWAINTKKIDPVKSV